MSVEPFKATRNPWSRGQHALLAWFLATGSSACYTPEHPDEQGAGPTAVALVNGLSVELPGGQLQATLSHAVIASWHAPTHLQPGQAFRIRLSSNFRPPAAGPTVALHHLGATTMTLVAAPVYPSPASVLGVWSVDVHGTVTTDLASAGETHTIEFALMDANGQLGPALEWNFDLLDTDALVGCPAVAQCGAQSCGVDPICGVPCGRCGPGQSCTDHGQCELVGSACPSASDCSGRVCGFDPVCGLPCGTSCTLGLVCTEQGQCVPDASTSGTGGTTGPANTTGTQGTASGDDSDDPSAGTMAGTMGTGDTLGTATSDADTSSDATGGSGSTDGDSHTDTSGSETGGCTPDCRELECGFDPACPREACGTCATGFACANGQCECQPQCAKLECGADPLCGVSCGTCEPDDICEDGACIPRPRCPDIRDCTDRVCGPDPICGASCGTCGPNFACEAGACVEMPGCPDTKECQGLECGPDPVCGDSCGTCRTGEQCRAGRCECRPACDDLECGDDPVCGESCGTCQNGEVCASGSCISSCEASEIICGGDCIDPQSESNFCGASGDCTGAQSGERCQAPEFCKDGACGLHCDADEFECESACVDPSTNSQFCGASEACDDGTACNPDREVCMDGRCVDPSCTPASAMARPRPPNVMLVLDKSRSMSDLQWGPSLTRWQGLHDVLFDLLASNERDASFGVKLFPSIQAAENGPEACHLFDEVEIPFVDDVWSDPLPNYDAAIPSRNAMTLGGTPGGLALDDVAQYLFQFSGNRNPSIAILLLDGELSDGTTGFQCPDELPGLAARTAEQLSEIGIPVFVGGIGDDVGADTVARLALAGGTHTPLASQNPQALLESLNDTIEAQFSCTFETDGQFAYPHWTIVETADGSEYGPLNKAGSSDPATRCADVAEHADGFVWPSKRAHSAVIELCGAPCRAFREDRQVTVHDRCTPPE